MRKSILTILLMCILFVVAANVTNGSSVNNGKTFIYLYLDNCTYCKQFAKNYNKLEKTYKKTCKFVKIPAISRAGMEISMNLGIVSVPFVLIIDNDKKRITSIDQNCIMDYACLEKEFLVKIK